MCLSSLGSFHGVRDVQNLSPCRDELKLRQQGDKVALRCHICARIPSVSRWKTSFGGSQEGKSIQIGGVRSVEKNYDWMQPNRLFVV